MIKWFSLYTFTLSFLSIVWLFVLQECTSGSVLAANMDGLWAFLSFFLSSDTGHHQSVFAVHLSFFFGLTGLTKKVPCRRLKKSGRVDFFYIGALLLTWPIIGSAGKKKLRFSILFFFYFGHFCRRRVRKPPNKKRMALPVGGNKRVITPLGGNKRVQ